MLFLFFAAHTQALDEAPWPDVIPSAYPELVFEQDTSSGWATSQKAAPPAFGIQSLARSSLTFTQAPNPPAYTQG